MHMLYVAAEYISILSYNKSVHVLLFFQLIFYSQVSNVALRPLYFMVYGVELKKKDLHCV